MGVCVCGWVGGWVGVCVGGWVGGCVHMCIHSFLKSRKVILSHGELNTRLICART